MVRTGIVNKWYVNSVVSKMYFKSLVSKMNAQSSANTPTRNIPGLENETSCQSLYKSGYISGGTILPTRLQFERHTLSKSSTLATS